MKTLLAVSTAAIFSITSQSAYAFSIKISSIKKQPAIASIAQIETLTLKTPEPLPIISALAIDPILLPKESAVSPLIESAASPVPVPAAAWLFGSGLLGLFGLNKKKLAINTEIEK